MKPSQTNVLLYSIMVLFLFCGPLVLTATETPSQLFEKANSAYSTGKFEEAATIYEQLRNDEGESAFLLYNLGNTYAQMANPGKAILNYERSLLLTPGESDTKGNLDLIRKNYGLFQEEISFGEKVTKALGVNQWSMIGLIFLILLVAVHVMDLRLKINKHLKIWASSCLVGLLLLILFITHRQYQQWHRAVIVASDAHLLISPFSSASTKGSIQEGRLVYPLKQHGGFYLIMDETGRDGWISTSAIEHLIRP